MRTHNWEELSRNTTEIIRKAKLGDALYTILEVVGGICECCNQRTKKLAIKKVYVGRIDKGIDGDIRLQLYRETPQALKNNRYGLNAEFRPVQTAFVGMGTYLAHNKTDLQAELEYQLASNKELDEFVVREEDKKE